MQLSRHFTLTDLAGAGALFGINTPANSLHLLHLQETARYLDALQDAAGGAIEIVEGYASRLVAQHLGRNMGAYATGQAVAVRVAGKTAQQLLEIAIGIAGASDEETGAAPFDFDEAEALDSGALRLSFRRPMRRVVRSADERAG